MNDMKQYYAFHIMSFLLFHICLMASCYTETCCIKPYSIQKELLLTVFIPLCISIEMECLSQ